MTKRFTYQLRWFILFNKYLDPKRQAKSFFNYKDLIKLANMFIYPMIDIYEQDTKF